METETKTTAALKALCKKNDPSALCELGIRHLTGLFGNPADPAEAW